MVYQILKKGNLVKGKCNYNLASKGQLISKRNSQAEGSPKKRTNEFVFTSMRRVFVRFLGESSARKKTFRDYLTFSMFFCSQNETISLSAKIEVIVWVANVCVVCIKADYFSESKLWHHFRQKLQEFHIVCSFLRLWHYHSLWCPVNLISFDAILPSQSVIK